MEHAPPREATMPTRGPSGTFSPVEQQLLDWQESGEHVQLEGLLATVLPLVEQAAKAMLHRLGIRDPSAVDEAISLVLDHLRRLPGLAAGDRAVKPFTPRHDGPCPCNFSDSGRAYLVWLARERAADVARAHRRHRRHATVFSLLGDRATGRLQHCIVAGDATCPPLESQTSLCTDLHEAIPQLPTRERHVIELLLEGKSQAAISHVLDVCEGTVSRLRMRAIARLRDILKP